MQCDRCTHLGLCKFEEECRQGETSVKAYPQESIFEMVFRCKRQMTPSLTFPSFKLGDMFPSPFTTCGDSTADTVNIRNFENTVSGKLHLDRKTEGV